VLPDPSREYPPLSRPSPCGSQCTDVLPCLGFGLVTQTRASTTSITAWSILLSDDAAPGGEYEVAGFVGRALCRNSERF
jgi:hypothetical protein